MELFNKLKEEKKRKKVKDQVDQLMKLYSEEKIDKDTYFKKMMDLATSHREKKKVKMILLHILKSNSNYNL